MRTGLSLKLSEVRKTAFNPALGSLFHAKYGYGYSTNGVVNTFDTAHTFTRASVADRLAGDGTSLMTQAAINIPRIDSRGALIEPSSTNGIRNSTLTGAVSGTPGTAPTNNPWPASFDGLTTSITDNPTYIDWSVAGTVSAGGAVVALQFETTTGIAALPGDVWTASVGLACPTGNLMTAFAGLWLGVVQYNSVPSNIGQVLSADLRASITTTPSRPTLTTPALVATTASIEPRIRIQTGAPGTVVNLTLRIYKSIQLEKLPYATSPILTSSGALTRAAETLVATSPSVTDCTVAGVAQAPSVLAINMVIAIIRVDASNYLLLRTGAADATQLVVESFVAAASTGTASSLTGALTANTRFGWCFRRAALNLSISVNGAAVVTAATGSMPGSMVQLSIGQNAGANADNSYNSEIAVFGAGKTDPNMQAYSTIGGLV